MKADTSGDLRSRRIFPATVAVIVMALTRNREAITILVRTVWPYLVPKAGPIFFIVVRFSSILWIPELIAMGMRIQCKGKNLLRTLPISSPQSPDERTAWAGTRPMEIKTRPPYDIKMPRMGSQLRALRANAPSIKGFGPVHDEHRKPFREVGEYGGQIFAIGGRDLVTCSAQRFVSP